MKVLRPFLTFFFLLFAFISLFAQNFAPLNAKWHYQKFCNNPLWISNCGYFTAEIYLDTIVNGKSAYDGTYFYVLVLVGCGQSQVYTGNILLLNSQAKMMNPDSTGMAGLTEVQQDSIVKQVKQENNLSYEKENLSKYQKAELIVYPNPIKDNLTLALTGSNYTGDAILEVYNMQEFIIEKGF